MKRLSILFTTTLLAMSTAACVTNVGKSGGGGWIPSVVPGAKATFGFHSKCEETIIEGLPYHIGKASFSYKDHGAGVSFKVAQMSLDETTHANTVCGVGGDEGDVDFTGAAGFAGYYTPQPATAGPGGIVYVAYVDNGLAGYSIDDAIVVSLEGGIYDGYSNEQLLSHGQIHIDVE